MFDLVLPVHFLFVVVFPLTKKHTDNNDMSYISTVVGCTWYSCAVNSLPPTYDSIELLINFLSLESHSQSMIQWSGYTNIMVGKPLTYLTQTFYVLTVVYHSCSMLQIKMSLLRNVLQRCQRGSGLLQGLRKFSVSASCNQSSSVDVTVDSATGNFYLLII